MRLAYPQKVTLTAASAQSTNAITTGLVVLWASSPFHYNIGANPSATLNDIAWPANIPIKVEITGGEKIAAILVLDAAEGVLYISEVTEE
jgi:hypothetical protein